MKQKSIRLPQILVFPFVLHLYVNVIHVIHNEKDSVNLFFWEVFDYSCMGLQWMIASPAVV